MATDAWDEGKRQPGRGERRNNRGTTIEWKQRADVEYGHISLRKLKILV